MAEAQRFFLDNAGWSTPPGREACAEALAEAEAWLHRQLAHDPPRASVEWLDDPEPEPSYELGEGNAWYGCVVRVGHREASLWSIELLPDDWPHPWRDPAGYARVVTAELASEILSEQRARYE